MKYVNIKSNLIMVDVQPIKQKYIDESKLCIEG
jgi:hypothetical protein